MEKTCSQCSAPFSCQCEARGCWCEAFTLSPETLEGLRQRFADCLCPACLNASVSEHKGGAGACINTTS